LAGAALWATLAGFLAAADFPPLAGAAFAGAFLAGLAGFPPLWTGFLTAIRLCFFGH
jgi:hypothetical protein